MKVSIFWIFILAQIVSGTLHAQSLSQAEYFVDADPGLGLGIPINVTTGDTLEISFAYQLGNLPKGWHKLSVRSKDDLGRWGLTQSKTFYVYDSLTYTTAVQTSKIIKAEYFFDTDPGVGKGTNIPIIPGESIDVDRYIGLNGLSTGTHRVYIRVKDETGSWSLYKTVSFTVTPSTCSLPIVDFTYDTVAYGIPVTFSNLTTDTLPGVKYKWDFNNDGIIDDTLANPSHPFPLPGVYQVKLTVANSSTCIASTIKDVVTGPLPDTTLLISGNLIFCEGDSVIVTSDNNPPGFSFRWNTGDTTQAITAKASGKYYAWVTNSYGLFCKSSVINVQVHPIPMASLSAANATGGNANGRIDLRVQGGSGNYLYQWSNAATSSVLNNLLPGLYSVTVNDGHCPVSLSANIANNPIVSGNIIKAEYFFDTDPGKGNATALLIRAGDTIQSLEGLPVAGLSPGYHYLYFRTCNTARVWGIAERKSFYVYNSSPSVQPSIQPPIVQAEYFFGTDPGVGNGNPLPLVESDSLSAIKNIPTTGIPLGFQTLYVRTKDAGGKWGLYSKAPFFVYDSVPKNLANTNSKPIAKAEYFFDTDPGLGNGTPITFNTNDSVSVERFVRVTGLADGTHNVYVRAMDEGGKWSLWQRKSFTVQHVDCTCPIVEFKADTVETSGIATQFTNQSTGVLPDATYEWDIDNDNIVDYTTPGVAHVYSQFGIYQAKLTIRNSDDCFASYLSEVVVSPRIDTSLVINGNLTFCDGDSVILTAHEGYTYNWNNGSTNQSITVKQAGNYLLRLTNMYGVQAHTRVVEVLVNPVPLVTVNTIDASGGNANGSAICQVNGNPEQFVYTWSCGGNLPIRNNLPEGDYWVTADNGKCPVTQTFHISNYTINAGDIVAAEYFFDTDPGTGNGLPLNISGGDTISFDTYIPMANLPIGYHNLFVRVKDTYNSWGTYLSAPFYVYDNGGSIVTTQPLLKKAEYFFDADPGTGNGNPVTLDLADEVDVNIPAQIQGLAIGYHTISLRAMDSAGKWGLVQSQDLYVYDSVYNPISVDQSKIVALEYFYDQDPGAGAGNSIPFNPTADSLEADRYLPVTGLLPGLHTVFIRAKDEAGVWSIYRNQQFTVDSVSCTCPLATFVADTVNSGFATNFTNTSGNTNGTTAYEWDINNDGSIEYSTRNISHIFSGTGVYNVKLRVINTGICQASVISQVVVGPVPNTNIAIIGNTTFCEGDSVILSASPGFNYKWWPGGETDRSITVKNSGLYYAWITTTSGIELKSETVSTIMHHALSVNLTVAMASGGNSNGNAFVEVSGGTGDYSYLWSSGSVTNYANSLSAGNYTVVVSDGYCPVTKSFTIENVPVIDGDIVAAEYYYNTDPGVGNGVPIHISTGDSVVHLTGLSVAGLPNGYNHLFVRVKDTYQRWSLDNEKVFFVYDTATNRVPITQPPLDLIEYFIAADQAVNPDPGVRNGVKVDFPDADSLTNSFNYSAENLPVGFHTITVRAKDEAEKWGLAITSQFYVYDTVHYNLQQEQPALIAAEYFFDTDPGAGNGIPISFTPGNLVNWSGILGIESLSLGSHYIYIRTKDAGNKWSIARGTGFGVYDCMQPTANFSFVPTCIENNVVFNNTSANVGSGATYQWDIDNNGSIDYTTNGNISHKFDIQGVHDVKLKITHNVACVDSIVKTVAFSVVQLGKDTTIYTDQSLVLDAGPGFVSYAWNNDSVNQTMTVDGAIVGTGLHSFKVVVNDNIGCVIPDSVNVMVTLPPRDLVITNSIVNPDTLQAGNQTSVSFQISNIGSVSAIASTLGCYLSNDAIKSDGDLLLADEIIPALEPGTSFGNSLNVTIPNGTSDGTWYLLLVADNNHIVTESDETNNIAVNEVVIGQSNNSKELQIQVLLQGLYSGNGQMNKAQNANGDQFLDTIADQITIELHNADNYSIVGYSSQNINLSISGIATVSIPANVNGLYYVTIKHRNSIETTSSFPVSFGAGITSYSFDSPAKAFGANLILLPDSQVAIYGGDVNVDGFVDGSDIKQAYYQAAIFKTGYVADDTNGDGIVDALDLILIDNNASNFVGAKTP